MKTPPAQLFLVRLQFAQSVSEMQSRYSMGPARGSQTPMSRVPLRYRAKRRSALIAPAVGPFMNLVSSRTACWQSGRSKLR